VAPEASTRWLLLLLRLAGRTTAARVALGHLLGLALHRGHGRGAGRDRASRGIQRLRQRGEGLASGFRQPLFPVPGLVVLLLEAEAQGPLLGLLELRVEVLRVLGLLTH